MYKQGLQAFLAFLFTFALDSSFAAEEPTPAADGTQPINVPLEADGLIAQALSQVGRWADSLRGQLAQIEQALFELPTWFQAIFNSEEGRQLLMQTLIGLAAVFLIGLAVEWGLRAVLRRPRRALIEHAEQAETDARQEKARHEERRRRALAKARTAQSSGLGSNAQVASNAGTQPGEEVALVQAHRHGVDQVDAVSVGPKESPGGGSAAAIQADAGTEEELGGRVAGRATSRPALPPSEHRSALRHLPFALGVLILDLLPLALFFAAASLVVHWLGGGNESIHAVTSGFINAYVITRVTMAVVRLLVSPISYGLCVLEVPHDLSVMLHRWVRRFVVLSTFSLALAGTAAALGASPAGSLVIIKLASLIAHVYVVILIFKVRQPVGEAIAAPAEAHGAMAAMRNWLAQVWTFFAAIVVMAAWVVWALGIENGFPRLIQFIATSVAIIIAARLVTILVLGALEGAFSADDDESEEEPATMLGRLAERYYPLIRRLVSLAIAVSTLIVLFQAWGLDAIGWFAPGTIGRNLLSATLTILIAVTLAAIVWQAANDAAERRLALWKEQGERMRAVRLRTLLPMLRSALIIIIVLIVGLTILNEIGVNTTPLLAGASIIGVAIGFGSQRLVQDFITGIFLLMENTMQVGDWVTVAGVSGVVEHLSIRTVRLRAGDGSLHIVPFSSVTTVNNTNRGIGNAAVNINVGYDTDIERAITELQNIGASLRSDPAFRDLILEDIEVWGVDSVQGSMITLTGRMQCIDKGRWGVQREINRRILERFRELGIEIADPRTHLLIPREDAWPDASPAKKQ